MLRRVLPVLCLAAGAFLLFRQDDADAAPAQDAAMSAANGAVICIPDNYLYLALDGGAGNARTGVVSCGNGYYTSVNVEAEDSTPRYLVWKKGTARGNYKERARKRCVGCNNGSAYQASVVTGQDDLICTYVATDDAGPAQIQSHDGGIKMSVECAR